MDAEVCCTRKLLSLLCTLTTAALWALPCHAQNQPQTSLADGSTIHVYANLLQIPVLILSQKHQPLPPIDPAKFSVRLGKDQPFRPRLVRQEGEDPITLAILLDGSARDTLMPQMLESLPGMADKQLSGRDRVSLYAMDGCRLRRFITLLPASGAAVKDSVERAVAFPPYDPNTRGTARCGEQPIGLWDAMDYLTRTLASEPGRRVVLAVTNGPRHRQPCDAGNPAKERKPLWRNAVRRGGAQQDAPAGTCIFPHKRRLGGGPLAERVTEASGGMVLETTRNNLPYTFRYFVELLRGRYIVEFSRPSGLTGGTSVINIDCGQPRAFIRSAGTSVPIADPADRYNAVAADAPGQVSPNPSDRRPAEAPSASVK